MLKKQQKRQQRGFTIVELLIVIVVIAILAAISIVAYNGIQTRVENTKTITAVKAYRSALRQYALENGRYPITGGACLGSIYKLLNSTTAGCRNSDAVLPNSTYMDGLKSYLGGTMPMPSDKLLYHVGGRAYAGAFFYGTNYNLTLNGESVVALWYTIEEKSCPVGPVYSDTGSPNYTGSVVTRTSQLNSNVSTCMILLPDAIKL